MGTMMMTMARRRARWRRSSRTIGLLHNRR
jgi:hypothetical protein